MSAEIDAESEAICDLPMIRAGYRWIEHRDRPACHGFRIEFRPAGSPSKGKIQIDEDAAEQFAAELEALAALIRARILRTPQSK